MARRSSLGRWSRTAAAALAAMLLLVVPVTHAQTPTPQAHPGLVMTAEPLLGAVVARGGWAAVRVTVQNDGPTINGELRLEPPGSASSRYGLPVELASGSRQQHVLYAPVGALGNRLTVTLASGSSVLAGQALAFDASDDIDVVIIGERPETLVGPIRDALAARGFGGPGANPPNFVGIAVNGLPDRVEAWAAIDLLVFHDVDAATLDAKQMEALRAWTLMGGDLLVLTGSLGPGALAGFPPDLLPFQPTQTVEVSLAELATMLGDLPAAAGPLPALAGQLERGTALASTVEGIVAARLGYGAGSSTLVGLNPATSWFVGPTADAYWSRFLPPDVGSDDARLPAEDGHLINALALPALQLPRSDHLLLLVLGYIVTIGPLNYLLLKRRDRREWAWLTMPLTIGLFAIAAYGLGVSARGVNVVVNELVVVHGAAGTDRGLADARVGVFSPSRAEFDVRVSGGALLSPAMGTIDAGGQRALDVLLGEPATVRRYGVGFGALRAFRAQAVVAAPQVEVELTLEGDSVRGTVTNASTLTLSDVTVVFSLGAQMLGELAPGESREVNVRAGDPFDEPLSSRLYPYAPGRENLRQVATRRAVVAHLGGGWDEGWGGTSGILGGRPLVLAWVPGGVLPVDLGVPAEHVGETLYVLTARAAAAGPVSFAGSALARSAVSVDAADGFAEGPGFFLSRGTITVDYRPFDVEGLLRPTALLVRLDFDGMRLLGRSGTDLTPLPAAEQPPGENPLAFEPRSNEGDRHAPRMQLFDRVAGTWVEFAPISLQKTYSIAEPERYVDQAGAFRVRFVVRGDDFVQFGFSARLEGTVE